MKKHLMIGLIIFVSIFCLVSCDNHEHDITEVRVDPTCTEEGAVYSTCECGYSNTLVIPALGHHFENGVCSCGEKDPETEKINYHPFTIPVIFIIIPKPSNRIQATFMVAV